MTRLKREYLQLCIGFAYERKGFIEGGLLNDTQTEMALLCDWRNYLRNTAHNLTYRHCSNIFVYAPEVLSSWWTVSIARPRSGMTLLTPELWNAAQIRQRTLSMAGAQHWL